MLKIKVIPKCRYEHGILTRVTSRGDVPLWGLHALGSRITGFGFFVELYVCPTCGYVELFDNDPDATLDQEK